MARKFHLAGQGEKEQAEVEMYAEQTTDLINELLKIFYEKDESKKKELAERIFKEAVPNHLKVFETRLAKIGTYLKALAAFDNNIPFYVAAPSSSIDFNMRNAFKELIIEERNPDEVKYVQGLENNQIKQVLIAPEATPA